jgi:flagellar assembly protein FliH
MSSVIHNNQASNAYRRLEFDQFDLPPQPPEPETEEQQSVSEPETDPNSPPEIAPGVSLPTLEDLEKIQQDAHHEGYAAGYEEGIARGRMEAAELHQMVQALDTAMSNFDQEVSEELQALAIEIARQVVRETLSVRPEVILSVVREALQSLPQQGATIHINPADMQLLSRYVEEHFGTQGHRLVEDTNVLQGGCVIESAGGHIDAQVQTRWRRVVENLTLSVTEFLDE